MIYIILLCLKQDKKYIVDYYISMEQEIPSNFRTLLVDFLKDLSITYSDYSYLWSKWLQPDVSDDEIKTVFEHCMKVYPERFFDILYQNEDIFKVDSEINVFFIPNVNFKLLLTCEGVTETTKKTIWKYLQLILFSIVGNVKDKASFGETMNLFEGINENDLQEKLKDTMSGITDFFSKMENKSTEPNSENEGEMPDFGNASEHFKNMFENMGNGSDDFKMPFSGMPNMENIHDHLKTLFDGKIGKLAKELAEEVSDEFSDLIGEDMKDVKGTTDVIKKLMKNPQKIMELMKKIGGKLDSKMKSGEISREELMKEAGDLMNTMKGMGGQDQFNEMFKKMASSMGMGKNVKMDTNALDRMTKQASMRDRMKAKLDKKKQQQSVELENKKEEIRKRVEEQKILQAKYSLDVKDSPDNLAFRLAGEELQEKSLANSFIHPDLLKETEKPKENSGAKKKKNKKKK
jgi:hypothetical protein